MSEDIDWIFIAFTTLRYLMAMCVAGAVLVLLDLVIPIRWRLWMLPKECRDDLRNLVGKR